MRTVIFSGGTLRPGRLVQAALDSADMVIAADAGAKTALKFGVLPSVVIGDFDSLDEATERKLRSKGVEFIAYANEKDLTDTELALNYAVQKQAAEIVILGAIEGGRIDHILAGIFITIGSKAPVKFINGDSMAWIIEGPAAATIKGGVNDMVSLIPLTGQADGVQTSGLKYPLDNETLFMNRSRGVSNVMTRKRASVKLSRGRLLLVQNAFEG